MIEVAPSFKATSNLFWVVLAVMAVFTGNFPSPSTANPMVAHSPMHPGSPMWATCHFADNSLIVIEEKMNQLFICLKDGNGTQSEPNQKKKEANEIDQLNRTYRNLVNRFANVSKDESPLPVLGRMRRQIWETLNTVSDSYEPSDNFEEPYLKEDKMGELEKEDYDEVIIKSSTSTSTSTVASTASKDVTMSPKWQSMVATCLEHYRILKRIILFERYLRGELDPSWYPDGPLSILEVKDKAAEKESFLKKLKLKMLKATASRAQPTWHQKMICKVSRSLMDFSVAIKTYTNCLIANKTAISGLAIVTMLLLLFNCFRCNNEVMVLTK